MRVSRYSVIIIVLVVLLNKTIGAMVDFFVRGIVITVAAIVTGI